MEDETVSADIEAATSYPEGNLQIDEGQLSLYKMVQYLHILTHILLYTFK